MSCSAKSTRRPRVTFPSAASPWHSSAARGAHRSSTTRSPAGCRRTARVSPPSAPWRPPDGAARWWRLSDELLIRAYAAGVLDAIPDLRRLREFLDPAGDPRLDRAFRPRPRELRADRGAAGSRRERSHDPRRRPAHRHDHRDPARGAVGSARVHRARSRSGGGGAQLRLEHPVDSAPRRRARRARAQPPRARPPSAPAPGSRPRRLTAPPPAADRRS